MTWGKEETMNEANTDDGWGSPEEEQQTAPRQHFKGGNASVRASTKPPPGGSGGAAKGGDMDFEIDDFGSPPGAASNRRDGGPRGDGGNRGGYRESRDENFNRGGGGRDRQWNDGGRDGNRPQRQNNDYQRGGRNNFRDSNNYGRDSGDREYGNRRFDNRNKGGDDDWDFEQSDNRGPPRRTPRSEDDFSRMRGGDRGGGGRGTPYNNRDRGGGGYEERGSRGGRDERDGNRGGNDHRYSRDGDPRGGGGRGNGPRDMDGGPPKQSYVPPEIDDCEGDRIRMGKNFAKYEETDVKITGPGHEDIQPLDTDFENSNLVPLLRQHLRAQQFERPTPVQKCAIPCILADKDIMACAQTGSGKTAAFLLPVISRLIEMGVESREMNRQVPDVVIVIPTRELAVQVHYEAKRFCKGSKLVAQVLYGGTDVRHQKSKTSSGCNILIGTPGRIDDFVSKDYIGLENCKYFILDEADRMLDMGFEPQMRKLAGDHDMPDSDERHTLLFSATFPDKVQTLAKQFLRKDYLFIEVGIVGGACQDVEQQFIKVENNEAAKSDKLEELVRGVSETNQRTLVFVETKRKADFIACMLSQTRIPTTSIHGGRLQPEREQALRDFKTGACPILVATSVAARGLDIPSVEHVINYELPKEIEDYVHRIGRTGRCGNTGRSTSFYDELDDAPLAPALVKTLSDAQQEVPDWLAKAAEQSKLSGNMNFNPHSRAGGRDNRENYRDRYPRDRNDNYRPSRPGPDRMGGGVGPRDSRCGDRMNQSRGGGGADSDGEWDRPPPRSSNNTNSKKKVNNDSDDGWSN